MKEASYTSCMESAPFLVGYSSGCYINKVKGQTNYPLHESKDSDYETGSHMIRTLRNPEQSTPISKSFERINHITLECGQELPSTCRHLNCFLPQALVWQSDKPGFRHMVSGMV